MQALSILLKPLDGSSLAFASLIFEAFYGKSFFKRGDFDDQAEESFIACLPNDDISSTVGYGS